MQGKSKTTKFRHEIALKPAIIARIFFNFDYKNE